MKPNITQQQLLSLLNLISDLDAFNNKKLGRISNVATFTNPVEKNAIFLRYEKSYAISGERAYEYRIASISPDGKVEFIDGKFENMFQRYAFLSECQEFDISDKNAYKKID